MNLPNRLNANIIVLSVAHNLLTSNHNSQKGRESSTWILSRGPRVPSYATDSDVK